MPSPKDEGTVFRPGGIGLKNHKEGDELLMEHKRAFLLVLKGPERGREFEIKKSPFILGRDDKADVTLPLDSVSRRHAMISCKEGKYLIKDMDSTNGTIINGSFLKRGKEIILNDKDKIGIGDVLIQFHSEIQP